MFFNSLLATCAVTDAHALRRGFACALTLSAPFLAVNLLDGFTKPALAATPALFWAYDVTKWVLLPAVTLFAMHMWCDVRPSDFGLRGPGRHWSVAQISALAVLFSALAMSYFAFQALAVRFFPGGGTFDLTEVMPLGAAYLPVVLYLCASAAFVEEFFYRGVLLEAMAPAGAGAGRAAAYVAFSSTLFGLSHFESGPGEILATGLYGVVAALFALRVRNLWPLMVGHFATDFVAFH
jgi:membrane protease YdiL (CAAX protease family)